MLNQEIVNIVKIAIYAHNEYIGANLEDVDLDSDIICHFEVTEVIDNQDEDPTNYYIGFYMIDDSYLELEVYEDCIIDVRLYDSMGNELAL